MNPFVNSQRRGIELPDGCRDLIDVLKLAHAPVKRLLEIPPKGIADIGYYLARLLASEAGFRSVWINGDHACQVALFYGKRGLRVLVFVDAGREQAVRAVFAGSSTSLIQDTLVPGDGPYSRALIYPLPSEASGATQFVRELLTKGLGLAENVRLDFRYSEKEAA